LRFSGSCQSWPGCFFLNPSFIYWAHACAAGPEAIKSLKNTIAKLELEVQEEKKGRGVQRYRALQQVRAHILLCCSCTDGAILGSNKFCPDALNPFTFPAPRISRSVMQCVPPSGACSKHNLVWLNPRLMMSWTARSVFPFWAYVSCGLFNSGMVTGKGKD
jgi:hypothetical protein